LLIIHFIRAIAVIQQAFSTRKEINARHRLVRHLVAGGAGTAGYFAIVAILVESFDIHPVVGVIVGLGLLEVYVYLVSRWWVYDATNTHIEAVPRFTVVIVISWALNAGIMYIANDVLGWWYGWGLTLTALVVPATNFTLNYFWTFKK
jgi:putative flippase GtrA